MELYVMAKKGEIMTFSGKWMELETVILSEVSQTPPKKKTSSITFLSFVDLKNKCIDLPVALHLEVGPWEISVPTLACQVNLSLCRSC